MQIGAGVICGLRFADAVWGFTVYGLRLRKAGYAAKPLLIRACPKVCFFGTTLGHAVTCAFRTTSSVMRPSRCWCEASGEIGGCEFFELCSNSKLSSIKNGDRINFQSPF